MSNPNCTQCKGRGFTGSDYGTRYCNPCTDAQLAELERLNANQAQTIQALSGASAKNVELERDLKRAKEGEAYSFNIAHEKIVECNELRDQLKQAAERVALIARSGCRGKNRVCCYGCSQIIEALARQVEQGGADKPPSGPGDSLNGYVSPAPSLAAQEGPLKPGEDPFAPFRGPIDTWPKGKPTTQVPCTNPPFTVDDRGVLTAHRPCTLKVEPGTRAQKAGTTPYEHSCPTDKRCYECNPCAICGGPCIHAAQTSNNSSGGDDV